MVSTLSSQTFASTYKDDFADSAGFHRILFNSGKALQARELTQLQTILQTQIERFGSNIFKEGAVVKPGGANLNQKYEFVKLNTTTNTLPTDTSTILSTDFTQPASGITVKVLQVVAATGSDPDTLYVQYINTGSTGGSTTKRLTAGADMNNGSVTLTVQSTNTTANPAVGVGILATLLSGIYYVRGHFVFVEDQSKIISKYTDTANTSLGYKVVEDVVTAVDNQSLYDNQGANPNLTAPGADRFRIQLTIAEESEVDSAENFVHIATIKDGVIYSAIDVNQSYNIPHQVVATRIKENSGDYIVKPFVAEFNLDSQNTHLLLDVSDGVAVVDGYRAARTFPTTIRVPKPVGTTTINNESTPIDFGNYVMVNPNVNNNAKGLPNINTLEKFNLRNDSSHGGSTIGTARVKSVNEDGIKLRFYLADVVMNSGQAFRNVKSMGTSGTNYVNIELENSKAVLKEASNNKSIFETTNSRPKSISDVSFAVQRRFTATASGAGQITLSGLASGETFTNAGDWIIGTDSDIFQPSSLTGTATTTLTGGNTGATIAGLPPSAAVEVYAYVQKSNPVIRQKTLTTKQKSYTVVNGEINLAKADIFELEEVVKESDSDVSYLNRFNLDNGQRDNHYGLGKLVLKGGQTAPTGNISVRYKYFEHATGGDLFAVNSYSGQIDYNRIPTHRFATGNRINLRNALDFRSVMDSGGEFSNSSKGARVNELPQPGTLITSDNEYYLARSHKLVVDREGIIRLFQGNDAFTPRIPAKPEQTLGLYDIVLFGNTDDDSDVFMKKIDHKRHTMKDITNLERRIDKIEELTSLNLLELETKHLQVLDSAGNDRTKSGFFVDNFVDHTGSFVRRGEYRAALDPITHVIRPAFVEDNVRLIYDSASSTNTVRKGDNIYMHYDEEEYINQNDASKPIRINPFSVVIYEGVCTLSPASDEWRDVDRLPNKIVQGGTRLETANAFNWNNWSWSWGGLPIEQLGVGNETTLQNNMVNRVVSDETIQTLVEDRVLQTAFLPFMRSRKVFFKASGLRPTTRVFAFLDGFNLANLVKSESFQFYGASGEDFGNTLAGVTAHPDGASTLTTDAHGEVSGSFIVPNNDSKRVRTGAREFKLLDISVDKEQDAVSVARSVYTATGYLDTKEATYVSTRVLGVQGFTKHIYQNYGGEDGGDHGPGTSIDASNANSPGSNSFGGNQNSGMGDPGADGASSGSGSKIICTALNEIYGFGSFRNKLWMKYNNYEKALYPSHSKILELGYHKVFGKLTEMMPNSPLLTKVLRRVARVRTDRIKREMSGKPITLESKLHVAILRPINYTVGWLVHKGILTKYNRKGL